MLGANRLSHHAKSIAGALLAPLRSHPRRAHIARPLLLSALLCSALACAPAQAATRSPFSLFRGLTPSQLGSVQLKLTYLGESTRPEPALVVRTDTALVNPTLFAHFVHPESQYANESEAPIRLPVSRATLEAMIDSVAAVGAATSGIVDVGGYISFALSRTLPDTAVFESVLDQAHGIAMARALRSALIEGTHEISMLDMFACWHGLDSGPPPAEITGACTVTFHDVRRDLDGRTVSGTVTVTNHGAVAPSPVSLVLEFDHGVEPLGDSGRTCHITPVGRRYFNLPIPKGLEVGQSVDLVVRVEDPGYAELHLHTPRVFAGAGMR